MLYRFVGGLRMKIISTKASHLGGLISFFCVRKYDDGTGMVIAAHMRMSDIVYLLNSRRNEDSCRCESSPSRDKYFVDEAEAHAYLKMWEAFQ